MRATPTGASAGWLQWLRAAAWAWPETKQSQMLTPTRCHIVHDNRVQLLALRLLGIIEYAGHCLQLQQTLAKLPHLPETAAELSLAMS